jgi:hypothetical protein
MDTRLWAGQPQRSASRQFGRTSVSDVVLFPARSAVPR